MKIAILGYGKEGKSAEQYFRDQAAEIEIFDNFSPAELPNLPLDRFDLILRSPSVAPHAGWSSMTQYFFAHCPAPIIGVTGTKGKGTTCSMLRDILEKLGQKVWLVGNIGTPALDVLDKIKADDVVIYEMSSFQLWDLEKSPHIAVVLRIEPDHLNIHKDFDDYVAAKSNIARHQTAQDYCIYYSKNPTSTQITQLSPARKIAFPISENRADIDRMLDHLQVVGQHNRDDAEAALLAAASFYRLTLSDFISQNYEQLVSALHNYHGLPHRVEFLRELNHVQYYDDNFSTTLPSTLVALKAFPTAQIVLIAGGRDKTAGADLPALAEHIQAKTAKTILIGESGHALAELLPPDSFILADTLAEAVQAARSTAEILAEKSPDTPTVVLMSPAAASFDMFDNVYDRGAKYQNLINALN